MKRPEVNAVANRFPKNIAFWFDDKCRILFHGFSIRTKY